MSTEFHIPESVVIAKSFRFNDLSFVSFFPLTLPDFSRRIRVPKTRERNLELLLTIDERKKEREEHRRNHTEDNRTKNTET
jgi:hypothetical protein